MRETYPLQWPEGRPRTLIANRVTRGAWKRTTLQYKSELEKELEKLGARNVVITTNVLESHFGSKFPEPRDPGVAVYFNRVPAEDDFSWQEVLGISNPDPKIEEIEGKFRELSKAYHPDNLQSGDIDLFKQLNEARKRAKAWVTGDYGREHEVIIECDRYTAIRHNMKAICIALYSLRRIEECGASGLLERAFKGFEAITEHASRE
jgi:hypothetical protein